MNFLVSFKFLLEKIYLLPQLSNLTVNILESSEYSLLHSRDMPL